MTVRRACDSRGINVSYSFADATRNVTTPDTQTAVAEMHIRSSFAWAS